MQHLKNHRLSLTLLFFSIFLAYPSWILPGIPGLNDLGNLNIPQRVFLADAYRHGVFPFWNPYNFGGQPFFAAGQSGPLYLPNLVYVLFPMHIAIRISYIFHECLIVFGMYTLVYYLIRHKKSAFVSAIGFLTCGFFVGHQVHTQMFDAFSWFPLLFFLFLRYLEKQSISRLIFFSICSAIENYAGHPQMTFFINFTFLLYILYYIFSTKSYGFKKIIRFLLPFIVPIGLSAAQLLPTLNLTMYSGRQDTASSWLLAGSLPFHGLLSWIIPPFFHIKSTTFYGYPVFWEFCFYVGTIFLIFALSSAFSLYKNEKMVRFSSFLIILFSLLSLGNRTLLGFILVKVPGFDLFRLPVRYTGLVDFFLCLLVGYGIYYWETSRSQKIRVFFLIFSVISFAFLLLLPIIHFSWIQELSMSSYLFAIGMSALATIFSIFSLVLKKEILPYLIIFFVLFHLCWSGIYSQFIRKVFLPKETPISYYIAQHLSKSDPFLRSADLRVTPAGDATVFDRSLLYSFPTINGYDSLVPKWYASWINLTLSVQPFATLSRTRVNNLDIKYLILGINEMSYFKLHKISHWKLVLSEGTNRVYKNMDSLSPVEPFLGNAHLMSWTYNTQTWKIFSKKYQTVIFSEMFDPNWKAFIDQKTQKIKRKQQYLLGVKVPKGSYILQLRYSPNSFYQGVCISGSTSVLLGIFWIFLWRKNKKK